MSQQARKLAVVREDEHPSPTGTPVLTPSAQQAKGLLQLALFVIFVGAGSDKYLHLMTNWEQYISPRLMGVLGTQGTHTFMSVDAVIEIILGIGVAIRPRIFAYIVSAWLLGITINLLTTGHFYDIALRDFALCLCAFALGRLTANR